MISYKKYIFLIFFLIIISSCATTSNKEKNIKIIENTQKIITVKDSTVSDNFTLNNNLTVNIDDTKFSDEANVRIKASINFKFPELSNSANAVIEMAKRDSILVTITGPFGISVGRLYANPNEFIMNNNLQNITFTGNPTEKNIMQIANIPLSFNDLMSILRTTTSQNASDYLYNSELSNNELLLFQLEDFSDDIAEVNLYQELVYINLHNDIEKIERKNIWGQTVMIANFTEHYTVDKYRFAKKINLIFPTLNGNVEVKISDISIITQPTNSMRFEKPKSYKEYRFE